MKLKLLLMTIGLGILLTACGGGGGGFSVKFKGKEETFGKQNAYAVVRKDLRVLYVLVANYDIDMDKKQVLSAPRAATDGQTQISFGVKGEGGDYENPVKPGEFSGDKVEFLQINRDNPANTDSVTGNNPAFKGKIIIKSITTDTVTGTIDAGLREDGAVKGDFTAKIIPGK